MTTGVIKIIFWVVSALVLIGLVIWFLTGTVFGAWSGNWFSGINIGGFESLTEPFSSQSVKTADPSNIHSLNINWVAGEITVIPHDGDEIIVTEYAQRQLRDAERFRISTDGGTLTIRFRENNNRIRNMPRKNLEVLVPRELSDDLNRLVINTTSGKVNVENFEASSLNISAVSAAVGVTNIVSQNIDINTTSGAVTASSARAGKLEISSVSGAANVFDSNVTTLNISTTSGRTNVSGEFDRVDVSTVSGSTTIRSTTTPSRMSVSSVSGATDVYIPNTGEITVSHSAVSGKFTSAVPVIMQSNAAYSFSSVSGNTNIHLIG